MSAKNKILADKDKEDCDVTYKILLLGDSGVGKTSIIRSLTGSQFSHNMLTTVGIDFVKVTFDVDGARVRLQIWDTAGQERFRSITRFQYRATKGLLLVYDITNRQSYETLSYWLNSIEKDIDQSNKEPIPIIIVGNKCDLEEARMVTTDEGNQVADKNFLPAFYETSAAQNANVRECFSRLAQEVTEVFNPELMNMYKRSSIATDNKLSTIPRPMKTIAGGKQTLKIKLKKSNKTHRKCNCN